GVFPNCTTERPTLRKKREEPEQLGLGWLRAVLANLERLGVLYRPPFFLAEAADQLLAEAVSRGRETAAVAIAGPGEPAGGILRDLIQVAEEPGVPLVELRRERVDAGDLLLDDVVDRYDHVGLERVRLLK